MEIIAGFSSMIFKAWIAAAGTEGGSAVVKIKLLDLLTRYSLRVFVPATNDPNDPIVTTDPNYSDDPDYIYVTEQTLQQWRQYWNPMCNLDNTEDTDTEYEIDLADLELFLDNWLWTACWRYDLQGYSSMMMGGGESMGMAAPMTMETAETASIYPVVEPDPETLEQNILSILDEIEKSIEEKHPNIEGLLEMKAFLEDVLWDLRYENP